MLARCRLCCPAAVCVGMFSVLVPLCSCPVLRQNALETLVSGPCGLQAGSQACVAPGSCCAWVRGVLCGGDSAAPVGAAVTTQGLVRRATWVWHSNFPRPFKNPFLFIPCTHVHGGVVLALLGGGQQLTDFPRLASLVLLVLVLSPNLKICFQAKAARHVQTMLACARLRPPPPCLSSTRALIRNGKPAILRPSCTSHNIGSMASTDSAHPRAAAILSFWCVA